MTEEITPQSLTTNQWNQLKEIARNRKEPPEAIFKQFKDIYLYDKLCAGITDPKKKPNRVEIALTQTVALFVKDKIVVNTGERDKTVK